MDKEGYYTSGEFAKKANVTLRTIRYYDRRGLLKPSKVADNGYRLYSEEDFVKLQRILSLKYLGFSLEEIITMEYSDFGSDSMEDSLDLQISLVERKIEHLKVVGKSLKDTKKKLQNQEEVNWAKMLPLLHVSAMERALVEQYKNATNLDIRIQLHERYSVNKQPWFQWLFQQGQLTSGLNVLEIGCGSGQMWKENMKNIPKDTACVLSDKSAGMVEDAREKLGMYDTFSFQVFDGQKVPYKNNSFDVVFANHVLFYMDDMKEALQEIYRVLKPGGRLIASTYGPNHMKEMTELIHDFDPRINLSQEILYDVFGLESGKKYIKEVFSQVEVMRHEDYLLVDDARPLISYIVSCHGNQQEYIGGRYLEFKEFVNQKMRQGPFRISKDAGCFVATKE